jgi:hypothetical protein
MIFSNIYNIDQLSSDYTMCKIPLDTLLERLALILTTSAENIANNLDQVYNLSSELSEYNIMFYFWKFRFTEQFLSRYPSDKKLFYLESFRKSYIQQLLDALQSDRIDMFENIRLIR